MLARAYLDVIRIALDEGHLDSEKEDSLLEILLLPNRDCGATPLVDLYTSAPLPSDVPSLRIPPILHPDLVGHPLLKRKKWRRPKFTMAHFLQSDALKTADENTRKSFWKWLASNERHIGPRDRPKIAVLAIWPDQEGNLCELHDLCEPRSPKVRSVLANSIRRPHQQVRSSKLVSSGSKALATLRRVPTNEEVVDWAEGRTTVFKLGEQANSSTLRDLNRFEADLVVLMKDKAIARILKLVEVTLPALAKDGSIQLRNELVTQGRNVDRLFLPEKHLLTNRSRASALNGLSSALTSPTVAMVLEAFEEDPGNYSALHSRLQLLLRLPEFGACERLQLATIPIIPVDGRSLPPSALAFRGTEGDYWGAWENSCLDEGSLAGRPKSLSCRGSDICVAQC